MIYSGSSAAGEKWAQMGSAIAGLMFAYAMFQQYFPSFLLSFLEKQSRKLMGYIYPYITITFREFTGERLKRSELYSDIENYLSTHSSTRAKRLKAEVVKDSKSVMLSMDDQEEVTDDFQGVRLWWRSSHKTSKTQSISFFPAADEKRYYSLTFHRRHRDVVTASYLPHVMETGKEISIKNRQRKLYTNSSGDDRGYYRSSLWSHVVFEHPASFKTLAMEPKKKQDIINDLITFSKAKDYYDQIGKAWKRGYLLYGPPSASTYLFAFLFPLSMLLATILTSIKIDQKLDQDFFEELAIKEAMKEVDDEEELDASADKEPATPLQKSEAPRTRNRPKREA
uniref:AAA-type ATPase N-terminal domain-containing protein n=1 Tax=Kalanchoe fedtschenkoi TaxID=63787 RepID=A0A7N0TKG1_KALFE